MNDVTMADLKLGTVALMFGNRMVVVVGVNPSKPKNCISYKQSPNAATYIAAVSDFTKVIGQVDIDAFNAAVAPEIKEAKKGTDIIFPWLKVPQNIKDMNLKVGDGIMVRHGTKVVQGKFEGWKWDRPKYPLTFSINGKQWKGPLEILVSKA